MRARGTSYTWTGRLRCCGIGNGAGGPEHGIEQRTVVLDLAKVVPAAEGQVARRSLGP